MHQKIGPVGQLRQALAVHGITADGNHLPLCLETIAVAHPALQECRREAEAIAVPDAVGRHPTVEHHVVKIADVIEVVVRQQNRIDAIKWNAGLGHLHDNAAASVEQDIVVADTDEGGGGSTPRVGPRAAGSQQDDLHFSRYPSFEVDDANERWSSRQ